MPTSAGRIEIRDLLNPISDSVRTTRPSLNLTNPKASNGAVQDQPKAFPDNIRYIPRVCQNTENNVYFSFFSVLTLLTIKGEFNRK